jgi:hypothetical protein
MGLGARVGVTGGDTTVGVGGGDTTVTVGGVTGGGAGVGVGTHAIATDSPMTKQTKPSTTRRFILPALAKARKPPGSQSAPR